MSFMRTLATLAVGFAAAKGLEQVQKMGGLDAMMKAATGPGGMGAMTGKMGLGGSQQGIEDAFRQKTGMGGAGAAQAGLGGLFATLGGAAAAGSGMMADMMGNLTRGTPVSDMAEQNARLMIRAMILAAKADGRIDPQEQAQILSHLTDASPDEIAFVKAEMAAPPDLGGLLAETQATMKAQVYGAALMAVTVDSPAETAFLQQLAQGLGLDPAARDAIHAAQGRAPLGV